MESSTVVILGERKEYKGTRPKPHLSPGNFGLSLITFGTFAFLYVPIAVLVLFSFNNARTGIQWKGFTLQWYERMIHNDDLLQAAMNSLVVAVLSTLISTLIGTLAALAMERYTFRGKDFWDGLLYMPVIIPEIVAGVSLLMFFAQTGFERGLATLVIAHVAFSMPFVYLTVRARLADFDRRVEEAAYDLGANELTTFWRVTLPLLLPGIVSGALLAFTLSIDDYIISFFVNGQGWDTLPIYIWTQIKKITTPEVNAVSTMMLALSILVVTVSTLLQRKNAK